MERVTATPALLLALLIAIAYNAADRAVLSSQIASLEAERDSLHSRVDLVEQAFTALLAQSSAAAALPARRLGDATESGDRATVRVDAPDGVSEIILGGEAAADNVVLRKAHERDGAAFTLSRSDTQVLRVDPAGNVTVLTDPLKVGGSLEVGGELLLGGVRLSAAMLSGMILNAGPLPPPAPPSPPPPPPPLAPPVAVYGQTPTAVSSTTGFTQQSLESPGCSYQSKDQFYMKDYGAMQWLDCAKEASKRQLMMHAGYSQSNVWGWAVLNPSRTHAQMGAWSTYQSSTIETTRSCHLSRDKDSLSQYSISLSDTTWLQADVDIGGVTVRWRYRDFGTSYHDQCMEFASRAGASITTPDTLGITWPSGTKYWIPSGLMCNTYWFMSASESGTSFTYDNGDFGARSSITVSCLAAFIEF